MAILEAIAMLKEEYEDFDVKQGHFYFDSRGRHSTLEDNVKTN